MPPHWLGLRHRPPTPSLNSTVYEIMTAIPQMINMEVFRKQCFDYFTSTFVREPHNQSLREREKRETGWVQVTHIKHYTV